MTQLHPASCRLQGATQPCVAAPAVHSCCAAGCCCHSCCCLLLHVPCECRHVRKVEACDTQTTDTHQGYLAAIMLRQHCFCNSCWHNCCSRPKAWRVAAWLGPVAVADTPVVCGRGFLLNRCVSGVKGLPVVLAADTNGLWLMGLLLFRSSCRPEHLAATELFEWHSRCDSNAALNRYMACQWQLKPLLPRE